MQLDPKYPLYMATGIGYMYIFVVETTSRRAGGFVIFLKRSMGKHAHARSQPNIHEKYIIFYSFHKIITIFP